MPENNPETSPSNVPPSDERPPTGDVDNYAAQPVPPEANLPDAIEERTPGGTDSPGTFRWALAAKDDAATWLVEEDFEPVIAQSTRIPGPGLLESAGWIFGFFLLQFIAGFLMALVVVLAIMFEPGIAGAPQAFDALRMQNLQQLMFGPYIGLTLCGIQLLLTLGAVGAVALRLGQRRCRLLPLRPAATWRHWLVIIVAWIPLAILCGQLSFVLNDWWNAITERFPQLSGLDEQSSMNVVQNMIDTTPFGWIVLAIAVGPAIAEELVFRGIIGRGLIARWGLPAGIALTSILFAAVHVHPVQAISLLPLAVFLHVSHIATRSIWAPILLHFLNNLLAVFFLRIAAEPEFQKAAREAANAPPSASPWIIVAGTGLMVVLLATLWSIRLRYYYRDGTEWSPGYVTAERPPAGLPVEARTARTPAYLLTLSILGVLLFFAAM